MASGVLVLGIDGASDGEDGAVGHILHLHGLHHQLAVFLFKLLVNLVVVGLDVVVDAGNNVGGDEAEENQRKLSLIVGRLLVIQAPGIDVVELRCQIDKDDNNARSDDEPRLMEKDHHED